MFPSHLESPNSLFCPPPANLMNHSCFMEKLELIRSSHHCCWGGTCTSQQRPSPLLHSLSHDLSFPQGHVSSESLASAIFPSLLQISPVSLYAVSSLISHKKIQTSQPLLCPLPLQLPAHFSPSLCNKTLNKVSVSAPIPPLSLGLPLI